jgi:hypothetical protein
MPTYTENLFSTGFENPAMGAILVTDRVKYSTSIVHVGSQSMHLESAQADAYYPVEKFSVALGTATYTAFAFYYMVRGNGARRSVNLCRIGNANLIPGLYQNQNTNGYCGSAWCVTAGGHIRGRATIGETSSGRTNGGRGDLLVWPFQTGEYNRTVETYVRAIQGKWNWISIYTETRMFPYLASDGSTKFVYDAKTSAKLNGEYVGEAECQFHNPYWSNAALGQNIGADLECIHFEGTTSHDVYIDNYVSSIEELPEGESLA